MYAYTYRVYIKIFICIYITNYFCPWKPLETWTEGSQNLISEREAEERRGGGGLEDRMEAWRPSACSRRLPNNQNSSYKSLLAT